MKKILLIVFILFTANAYSQKVTYGITAGLNYTNLAGPGTLIYPSYNDYNIGFRAGVLLDVGYKSFSIQPSVLFTSIGGRYVVGDPLNNVEKLILSYVEIPVNFIYRVKANGGSFFIGGGPFGDIGILGKYSNSIDGQPTISHSFTIDGTDRKFDVGLDALAGYRLKLGLEVSAGYNLSLTNIYTVDSNVKNQGFNLSVSYLF